MGHCLFMRKGETHTAPLSGILASDIAVGSSVYLMEDGSAVEYLVVNQGIPSDSSLYDTSCDGMWLLRKDIHSKLNWNSSGINTYASSNIHSWLNGDFFNTLGEVEKSTIKQVKIPYCYGNGNSSIASGASGLSCKIFLISAYELGYTSSDDLTPNDGANLSYFYNGISTPALNMRIAYMNGTATYWWLRSPDKSSMYYPLFVFTNGTLYTGSSSSASYYGVRPALVLPFNALFDKTTMLLKGVA